MTSTATTRKTIFLEWLRIVLGLLVFAFGCYMYKKYNTEFLYYL